MSVVINPNWPVMDYAWCPAAGPSQSPVQPFWCSLRERTKGKAHVERGKQYELDQYQPGTATFTIRNLDSAFDPTNVSSPFYGYVIPYRLFRIRAQWPPTPNLLTPDQATAGRAEAGLGTTTTVLPADVAPWSTTGLSIFNISPTLNQYIVGYGASPPLFTGLQMTGWSVVAGETYTVSGVVNASANAGISMYFAIQWFAADGVTVVATSNGTPSVLTTATSTLSLTATAPANAAGGRLLWLNSNSPATAVSAGLRTVQLERAAAPSTYVQPGHWYSLFTGYIERFPQQWGDAGNNPTLDLEAFDLFAYFSNRETLAPFLSDLLALNPNFLYPLDEAAGTTAFADLTNKRGAAVVSAPVLSLVATGGQSVESGDNNPQGPDRSVALTGAFLGAPGPVLHSSSPTATAAAQLNGRGAILIPPDKTTGQTGPPATGGWTRLIAARLTALTTSGDQAAWQYGTVSGGFIGTQAVISVGPTSNPLASATLYGVGANAGTTMPGLGNFGSTASTTPTDTDWHLFGMSLSADSLTLKVWCDGSTIPAVQTVTGSARTTQGGIDSIGGMYSHSAFDFEWNGDLAFATELPFEMDGATWAKLAGSWRNAWSTTSAGSESSDTRYQRILNWLGYTGPTRLSFGVCRSVGPAVDVAGQAGLQALQAVVDTENGQHFIAGDGIPVFQARSDRYSKTPTVTFGENAPAGEIPYMSPVMDFDPTRIANDVQIAATFGNAIYRAVDGPASNPATSQGKYGTITLQRTVNSIDPNELTNAAKWLLWENKDAHLRTEEITVRASAMPTVWASMLGLELGQCGRIKRRPSGGNAISMTGFIEKITWDLDGDSGVAECAIQMSNNETKNVSIWDSSRWGPDPGSLTVSSALTAASTTVVLATAAGSPTLTMTAASYPFDIVVDREQITLTGPPNQSVSPQTYTGCVRGVGSLGPAATHAAGAQVTLAQQGLWGY